jgi:hypothetical protein
VIDPFDSRPPPLSASPRAPGRDDRPTTGAVEPQPPSARERSHSVDFAALLSTQSQVRCPAVE